MKKIIYNISLIGIILIVMSVKMKDLYTWKQNNDKTVKQINEIEDFVKDNNLEKLKEINPDVIGTIKVNDTNIDYPIVQASNNNYYMNHSLDKSLNNAGWIFLDYRNNLDNLSKNNIIYGHARYDGTMFGTLKKVLNKDWYQNKNNHLINIISNNKVWSWKIISIYIIKKEGYYLQTDFETLKDYRKFLDIITQRSIYNFNEKTNVEDKILTLSTCNSINKRLVVHAKLIVEK